MPKVKTSKTISKRIVVRSSGSVKFGRVCMRHGMLCAPARRKRKACTGPISATKLRAVKHLLPYGGIS